MYIFVYFNYIPRAALTAWCAKQCTVAPTYTNTHRNKYVNGGLKLNTYLLYWNFQQNQCLNIKNMPYTTYID
jgi:hypothetical protein